MKTLLGVTITPLSPKIKEAMSNWLTIAEVLYTPYIAPNDVLDMYAYELQHSDRKMIKERLLARYTKLHSCRQKERLDIEVETWQNQKK